MSNRKQFMKEIGKQTIKELVKHRRKLKDELYSSRMKHSIKGLKQTHTLRDLRKKIARINTLLTTKIKTNYGNNMK